MWPFLWSILKPIINLKTFDEGFWTREIVWDLLLEFARHVRNTKQKFNLLESMKDVYAQLVVQKKKKKKNLPYRNVFLTTMVSHQSGPSQRYIYWTIGGCRYLLSKAITRKIHVDLIVDNIWGGLPHMEVLIKCHQWKWSLVGLEFLGCYYNNFTSKEGCKAHTYKSGELGGTSHSLFTRDASKLLTAHVFMFI
jgi:hypothetical protein